MSSRKFVIATAFVLTLFAGGAATAAPLDLHAEAAAHPDVVEAIHHIDEAIRLLEASHDDFGGHKGEAIRAARAAAHQAKKALYYRLKMDDEAIDAARY